MRKYHIITYGCQMNEHDSENIAGLLEAMGYEHADDPYKADVTVINTCTTMPTRGSSAPWDSSRR